MGKALGRLLRSEGYVVHSFESAPAFLAYDGHMMPSCAVFDIRMPPMDGLALHAALRQAGRALPVVFITGHGDVRTSVQAMKDGAIDFLEKPFTDEALLRAVRTALQASERTALIQEDRQALARKVALLTPRERQVFALVAQGLPNKVVGARIGTTEKTVKVHRARVMEKMAADSLADLVRMAQKIDPGKP